MPKIKVLPKEIAEPIAAGEVVEEPASRYKRTYGERNRCGLFFGHRLK